MPRTPSFSDGVPVAADATVLGGHSDLGGHGDPVILSPAAAPYR